MTFLAAEFVLKVAFFLSLACLARGSADTSTCGQKFSTRMDEDVFRNHRFRSRVIESQPISRPLECHVMCMKNCRCLSYNICNGGKSCELNYEKKESNASLYEQTDECDYYGYEFSEQSSSGECLDPCCSNDPCLYGGRCEATCMRNNKRFQCDCANGYSGDHCQIVPRTCASYVASSDKTRNAGLHVIYGPNNGPFSAFCYFNDKFAMTLVMSFSRAKHTIFAPHSLEENFQRNENAQNWEDYRLALARMQSIRDHGSTHWIYSCSYPTHGVTEVDYLRSKFSETDILTFKYTTSKRCTQKLQYLNIRGKSCSDCSVVIAQIGGLFYVSGQSLDCGGLVGMGAVKCSSTYASYFGRYYCYNTLFTCTASDSSSTNLWFAQSIA